MNRKRKVIFVGKYKTAGNIYSIQNVSFEVFKIHSSKENSDFICYYDDGNLFSKYQKLFGKKIEYTTLKGKIIRTGIIKFLFYLLKNRNAIIHIISFEKIAVFAVILKHILNFEIIYTIHGIDKIEDNYFLPERATHKIKHRLSQYLLQKFSDTIIVPSNLYKELVILNLKITEKKIRIIPNGISKSFFRGDNENKIINNIKLFSIANPEWKTKGYDFLIDIIKNLDINYEFNVICGNNEMVNNLYQFKINCYNNMPQEKFAELLAKMNIVLITSKVESFSMLTVEAMSLGRVCIITDTCGATDYIMNKKNGYIVKYSDTETVVKIIKELLNNQGLFKSISEEARKIYNLLNWEKVYKNYYKKIYLEN